MMIQEPSGGAKAAVADQMMKPASVGGGATEQRRSSTLKPPDQVLKCPRCDSLNTKFCYYNNYSLTQPRHFCKSCRRYWTKGGALRNVPVGGGCRKNKRANKRTSPAEPERRRHHIEPVSAVSSGVSDVTNRLTLLQNFCTARQPAVPFMEFPGLAVTSSAASGCGLFGSTTTAGPTSILQSSCQALSNLPSLETTLLGLDFPAHKAENLNARNMNPTADLNSLFESSAGFNIFPTDSFSAADLQYRIQQHRLAMLVADQNESEKEFSRLHIKPCKPELSCLYNNNSAHRAEWQPVAPGITDGHHAFEGAVETGYWNPMTAWSDFQHYASSAGALQ